MPVTVVLVLSVLSGLNTLYLTGHNVGSLVHGIKVVHQHTTKQVYTHVLKPVGHTVEKATK